MLEKCFQRNTERWVDYTYAIPCFYYLSTNYLCHYFIEIGGTGSWQRRDENSTAHSPGKYLKSIRCAKQKRESFYSYNKKFAKAASRFDTFQHITQPTKALLLSATDTF